MQAAGARIVNIGPVADNLDGAGVEWIRLRPSTDTALMIAIAWVLLEEGLEDRAGKRKRKRPPGGAAFSILSSRRVQP